MSALRHAPRASHPDCCAPRHVPPCSDLAQHGVILVVTAADHHGIRPLLLAHGVPLPPAPMHWPPEMAQPQTTGGRYCAVLCNQTVRLAATQAAPRRAGPEAGPPAPRSAPAAANLLLRTSPALHLFRADVVASTRGSQAGSPRRGGSLAAEQPWESGQYPDEVFSEEGGQLPSCLEFRTLEEGLRWVGRCGSWGGHGQGGATAVPPAGQWGRAA